MDQQMLFKTTAIGGFDKTSVTNYINQITEQVKKNEELLTKKLEDLHKLNKELAGKNEAANIQIDELKKQISTRDAELEKEKTKLSRSESMIESLKSDILKYSKLVEKNAIELESQINRNRQLSDKIDEVVEKGRKYETSVMQIGSAMLEAQEKADVIVSAAQDKASKISDEADKILNIAAEKIEVFKNDVSDLRSIVERHVTTLMENLSKIDGAVDIIQNKFVNHYVDTKDIIDQISKKYDTDTNMDDENMKY